MRTPLARAAQLTVVALTATCAVPRADTVVARANDNRVAAAGERAGDTLTVRLVAQRAKWFPASDSGPSLSIGTLAIEGQQPLVPAPLIRTRVGTHVRVRLRNTLTDTLVLCAPLSSACAPGDTLPILPGATREIAFIADRPGAFVYRAMKLTGRRLSRGDDLTGLTGALLIDTTDAPRANERVFVISGWQKDSSITAPFVLALNGKIWPYSERFDLSVGDSVHWHVLNTSGSDHPMHLHGFYFRVDARGDLARDTVYGPEERGFVVTENVRPLQSALISWAPSRAGNWLFHCHKGSHMSGQQMYHLAGVAPPDSFATHDASDHAATTMAGLVLGISVRDTGAAAVVAPPAARRIRLHTREAKEFYHDKSAAYVFALDEPAPRGGAPRPVPGPLLTLTRGDPVEIAVINELRAPTTVHWHGIELESFYDGVGGWSGNKGALAPMVAPSDSFIARFTPVRSGTFMYHAHADEVRQLASGLYGPIVVLEPGARWNPDTDHVLLFSQRGKGDSAIVALNGGEPADTIPLRAGMTHRLRFINITVEDEVAGTLHAAADSTPLSWRVVAKDGMTTPKQRVRSTPARLYMDPGETMDAEVTLAAGDYTLDIRSFNNFPVVLRVRD
jgi:FtsP/CotA-like multicopper oxidase with cupredoxin domain